MALDVAVWERRCLGCGQVRARRSGLYAEGEVAPVRRFQSDRSIYDRAHPTEAQGDLVGSFTRRLQSGHLRAVDYRSQHPEREL